MSEKIAPAERMARMRRMFAKTKGVLAEDYDYFTKPGEPIRRSKAARKSAERPARRALKRS
jgi:hypothetical protein